MAGLADEHDAAVARRRALAVRPTLTPVVDRLCQVAPPSVLRSDVAAQAVGDHDARSLPITPNSVPL